MVAFDRFSSAMPPMSRPVVMGNNSRAIEIKWNQVAVDTLPLGEEVISA